MNLKGHAIIELTDVKTGKKQVVEHDNMLTNSINYIMGIQPFGSSGINDCTSFTDNFSVLRRLFGGILLYDRAIEENVNRVYPPADCVLTGCGSGIPYNGSFSLAGSFNDVESGVFGNSAKLVWDFSTSQANGTIACACLTTQAGGKVTTGSRIPSNDYLYQNGDQYTSNEVIPFINKYFKLNGTKTIHSTYIDGTNNLIYQIPYSSLYNLKDNKSVEVLKYRIPITNLSVLDNLGATQKHILSRTTVNMPESLHELADNNAYVHPIQSNGYVGLFFVPKTDVVENYYLWRINTSNYTSEVYTIPNTYGFYRNNIVVSLIRNQLFVVSNENKLYCYNLTTNDWCEIKTRDNNSIYVSPQYNRYLYEEYQSGRIVLVNQNNNNNNKFSYSINPNTLEVDYLNYSGISNNYRITQASGVPFYFTTYDYIAFSYNPAMLMTINNLSVPITKTAAQTMKVTYTLTQV